MPKISSQFTVSLDGYGAGPDQSREDPLGVGAERLHRWMFETPQHPVDAAIVAHLFEGVGAYVMGRNMFGGRADPTGAWDPDWHGWWGEDPPYHAPVFVITHHEHEPMEMEGGTTFHFVTDGPEAALEAALEAAGEGSVHVAGGVGTVNAYLAAGAIDELFLHVAPVILGAGERLFEGVGDLAPEPVEATASPLATHVRYRFR